MTVLLRIFEQIAFPTVKVLALAADVCEKPLGSARTRGRQSGQLPRVPFKCVGGGTLTI